MAQKIHPRSLRSQKQLFTDSSFFSENRYAKIWGLCNSVLNSLVLWSQSNLIYKNQRKKKTQKRVFKNKKLIPFLKTRMHLFHKNGIFQVSPVLFKFAHESFSKKYNPMKAFRKKKNLSKNTKKFLFLKKS